MVTRYENLSGVNANYIDGSFASLSQVAAGQSIMLMGAASKGLSNTPFLVQDVGAINAEFGKGSSLVNLASQISDTDAANIFVTRIGGKQSHFILEKSIPDSSEKETLLRITPVERGDESVFDDIKVALLPVTEGDTVRQRVVLFNAVNENVIFDSEEILNLDDTAFEVVIGNDVGEVLISKTSSHTFPTNLDEIKTLGESDPRGVYAVSELASLKDLISTSTFTNTIARLPEVYSNPTSSTFSAATLSVSGINTRFEAVTSNSKKGDSGDSISHCERFAAMESAYADLEDAGIDFMYCDGCYADIESIPATGLTNTQMERWDKEFLGTAHKTTIAGQCFVTMFASPDPLSTSHVVASTVTVGKTVTQGSFASDVKVIAHSESIDLGLLLTLNDIRIEHGASSEVEEYFEADGRLKVNVKAALTATTAGMVHGNGSFSAGTLTIGAFQIETSTLSINIPEKAIDVSGMNYADEAALIKDHTQDVKLSLDLRNLSNLMAEMLEIMLLTKQC